MNSLRGNINISTAPDLDNASVGTLSLKTNLAPPYIVRRFFILINCSIALQILPLDNHDGRLKIIDKVIYYLQNKHSNVIVTPFETVIEGEFNELMDTLKECFVLAGEDSKNIFANVKINYGDVLTINEKIDKFNQ